MKQPVQPYDHVIIIDLRRSYLIQLKQALLSINYAKHVSCFENPKIAIKYIRNCKKIPEVVYLNMMQMMGLEFVNLFITEFTHLTKFIFISSYDYIIDLARGDM
jgi:two-component SAPR family response regulator